MPTTLRKASFTDLSAICDLLNKAYRGDSSRAGWTTEADLIDGEVRTHLEELQQLHQQNDSVFLVVEDEAQQLIGTVNLQVQPEGVYLGMLAVSPDLQGGGIGKQLLYGADDYARSIGRSRVFMTVISARKELISWYERHGYRFTGKTKPFQEDGYSGTHRQPLTFMYLEKKLDASPEINETGSH